MNSRRGVSQLSYALWVSLANFGLFNIPLLVFAYRNISTAEVSGWLTLSVLLVVVLTATFAFVLVLLFLSHRVAKGFILFAFSANAAALYFVVSFGVILDKSMVGNILNTNYAEAVSYLNFKIVAYLVLFGILPALFFARIRVVSHADYKRKGSIGLVAVVVGLLWSYANSSSWLWIDQHAKTLGGMVLPWSYIVNFTRYQQQLARTSATYDLLPVASVEPIPDTTVVLIIGETARAKNFSLYGYDRQTNPVLSSSGVIALKEARSCSTYTTESLRCILSSSKYPETYEPLPNYLTRLGVEVNWRTNNWGEPNIVTSSYQRKRDLIRDCASENCAYDEVLMSGLRKQIETSVSDRQLIVLHQRGSHGPAYFKEYPSRFSRFEPTCKSVELNSCSRQELTNAYDNTILYTDHVIGEAIDILKKLTERSTILIYVSDHGESLGEDGLYLHGTPMLLAPPEQTRIPFVVWLSDRFVAEHNVDLDQLRDTAKATHAHVFHSILGALQITTDAYNPELDVFRTTHPAES
ncbi:MAG: phosphoethanolamine--lipid A transferase EptA [Pseudomonadales bacterium]